MMLMDIRFYHSCSKFVLAATAIRFWINRGVFAHFLTLVLMRNFCTNRLRSKGASMKFASSLPYGKKIHKYFIILLHVNTLDLYEELEVM